MDTSLVHTHPYTFKIDPFNGTFFKRWKERVCSSINVVNLGHILTYSKPKSDSEDLSNGKMRTNKLGMPFLRHSQMKYLMSIVNIK